MFGAQRSHGTDGLYEHLPKLLAEAEEVYFRIGTDSSVQRLVVEALQNARLRGARKASGRKGSSILGGGSIHSGG